MFTDDANVMRRIKTKENSKKLQDDLDKLKEWANEWANKWLLKLNSSKCEIMKLGVRSRRPDPRYQMGDEIVHEME